MTAATLQAKSASPRDEELTPQARRAVWGAFVGFFVGALTTSGIASVRSGSCIGKHVMHT